jgi:hypothetical protein
MSVKQKSKFGRNEQVAAVTGSILGAIPAGMFMQVTGGDRPMEIFAQLVGGSAAATGWTVWLTTSLIFGVFFGFAMAHTIVGFTNTIIMITRKLSVTRKALVPLLHRSALGTTAWGMGLTYGNVLGFGFFAYLVPITLGINGYYVSVPLANFTVIFGYLLYSQILGATYGILLEQKWFDPAATATEQNAAAVGAVVGGLAGSGVLYAVGGRSALVSLGGVVGGEAVFTGVATFVGIALVLGIVFSWVLARTINDFTNTVIMFSRRSKVTQAILVPLIKRAALTVTAGSMGLIYGLVAGVGYLALASATSAVPALGIAGVLAFAVFGSVLGNTYGLMIESVGLTSPSEEVAAGIRGSVIAGLVSGLLILGLVLAGVVPRSDPLLAETGLRNGFAIWMGLSLLFGLAFVGYVSRTINDFTNTVIMFSRRSKVTQKILVPLIQRAALTVTAGSMGLGFGLVAGVVFFGVLLVSPLPNTTPLVIVPFVVYGQVLGTAYGLQLEEVSLGLGTGASDSSDSTEAGSEEPLADPQGFAAWRARRPFAGGTMLILAGMIIGAIPLRLQSIAATAGASKAALGIVFAAMVIACGVFAMVKPELSTLIGVTGVAMSILSLIGAFGGLVIGMLVGIVGGNLCIAWQDPNRDEDAASESRFKWIGEGERQQW